jgi:hypothetical protein
MEMIMSKCGEGRALNLRVVGLGGLRHDDRADEEAVGAGATAKKHMGVECGSDGSVESFPYIQGVCRESFILHDP